MIALAAATMGVSEAQNTDCICKKKIVHHRACTTASSKTQKQVAVKKWHTPSPMYNKTTVSIKQCPEAYNNTSGCIYDNDGNVSYVIEGVFTGNYPDKTENTPGNRELSVTSPAFKNFGVIPAKYTCLGDKASPPLAIANIPNETKSLAVIMYDTHASAKGGMTYWMMWNVDTGGTIPENFVNDYMAMNSANEYGYQAVCPVSGTHYYHFVVYALDTKLRAGKHTSKDELEAVIRGHILARGELTGEYNKLLD